MVPATLSETMPLKTDTDGVIRVGGTRVPIDTLIAAYHEGATAEEIADQYPAVKLADVYASLGYYLKHRSEIDAYLERAEAESSRVRMENGRRNGAWPDLRARLLARGQAR
jgi:uncharacterized protein (DUF433 family)